MTELGEAIATTMDDLERTKRSINNYTGSIYRLNIFSDTVTIDDTYLKIQKRQIGTAFILGHGVNGKLGVQGTQPVLGVGTMGAWTTIVEYSGATSP